MQTNTRRGKDNGAGTSADEPAAGRLRTQKAGTHAHACSNTRPDRRKYAEARTDAGAHAGTHAGTHACPDTASHAETHTCPDAEAYARPDPGPHAVAEPVSVAAADHDAQALHPAHERPDQQADCLSVPHQHPGARRR
ncbi:MAG: hypothetical protein IJV51_00930 [Oscillospiraceae bacterium]|nr:hypothetical protein [Oscillospiraceae bacterium]